MGKNKIDDEKNYLIFVLGYDLLHTEFGLLPCDIAYERATQLIEKFMQSDEYLHSKCSVYDALKNWLDNNRDTLPQKELYM